MVFQDPYASLDPRMTVSDIIARGHGCPPPVSSQGGAQPSGSTSLLDQVGLNKEHANRFPHEFSGGQRQRIGIARALAVEPEVHRAATSPSPRWTCPFRHRSSTC